MDPEGRCLRLSGCPQPAERWDQEALLLVRWGLDLLSRGHHQHQGLIVGSGLEADPQALGLGLAGRQGTSRIGATLSVLNTTALKQKNTEIEFL